MRNSPNVSQSDGNHRDEIFLTATVMAADSLYSVLSGNWGVRSLF